MRRQEIYGEKHGMAVGFDDVFGGFIQVWKLKTPYCREEPDVDNIVLDEDGLIGNDFLARRDELVPKYLGKDWEKLPIQRS